MPLLFLRLFYRLGCKIFKSQRSRNHNHSQPKVHLTVKESQHEGDAQDTIVLIHGFPDSPAMWNATVNDLTSLGYRCLLVGLPGCTGESVEAVVSLDVIVDQIYNVVTAELDKIETAQAQVKRVTFIGHDYGAGLAILVRKKYPQFLHHIVLVDVGEMPFILHIGRPTLPWVAYGLSNRF